MRWSRFLELSSKKKSYIWPVGTQVLYDNGKLPQGLTSDHVHTNDILDLQRDGGLPSSLAPGKAADWLITYCSQPTNEDPSTLEGRVNDLEVSSVVKVDVGGSREDSFLEFDQMDLSQNNEKFLTIKSADNPGVTIGEFETPNGNKVVFRAPAPSIENLDVSVEQSSDTADPDNSKIPTTAKVWEMMDAVGLSIDKPSRDEIVHSSSTSTWIELTTPLHAGVKYILTSDVSVTMYVNRSTSVGSQQLHTSSPLYLTPEVDITSIRLYKSGGYGGNGMNLRIRDFLGATSRLTKIDNAVSANSHSIPTAPGVLAVRNAIPSYFLNDLFGSKTHENDLNLGANESDPDPNPINLYLDKIINSVPEGRSIITWADQHWEGGNKKHSPELISYVRQRLGIRRVAMLGDAINGVPNASGSLTATEQGAIDVLTDFAAKAIAATGYDCALPCTGNHDANTQGGSSEDDDSDGAETGAYLHPVNMYNALFRHTRCHTFYDDNKDGIDAIIAAAEGKTADDAANLIAACKMSYYVDDALLRTRFVAISSYIGSALSNYIPTGKYAYMFQWLLDVIGDTPEGYDLAILMHTFDGWSVKNEAGSTSGGAQFARALMARKLRIDYRGYMTTPTNVRS